MNIEVTRYRKADGYATRYWSVLMNGELLVVTVYKKGAQAVVQAMTKLMMENRPDITRPQLRQQHAAQAEPAEDTPSAQEPEPSADDSQSLGDANEFMTISPESETARRKRKRRGCIRKMLGDCPF